MFIKWSQSQFTVGILTYDGNNSYITTDETEEYLLALEDLMAESVYYDAILDDPTDIISFNELNELYIDQEFPVEEALVQPIIDLCLKELGGALYRPRDVNNNAGDDLSNINQNQQQ